MSVVVLYRLLELNNSEKKGICCGPCIERLSVVVLVECVVVLMLVKRCVSILLMLVGGCW